MDARNSDTNDGRAQRLGSGIAIGLAIGVALSAAMDNWSMLGVGLALGVVFGVALGGPSSGTDPGDEETDLPSGPGGPD